MTKKKRIYFETEEVVKTTRKGYVEIDADYTQVYHSIFSHTKNLKNKFCLHYLLWVISKSNADNMIPHNKWMIKEFAKEFKSPPAEGTIRNAITELVKNKLLIKYSNSSYQLNPAILWSDDTAKRVEHIKSMDAHDIDYKLLE